MKPEVDLNNKNYIYREKPEKELIQALESEGRSEFFYLRGRRRVGKSTLLKKYCKQNTNCFYFIGMADESSENTYHRFAKEWDHFLGVKHLSRFKKTELSWSLIFDEITKYIIELKQTKKISDLELTSDIKNINKNKIYRNKNNQSIKIKTQKFNLVLLFDEIQWICKGQRGFVGNIKDKWLTWEQLKNVHVVICGSSNKFFVEQTGGEEKILRGLKTRADIVLPPLSIDEVRKNYFSTWNSNEVILTYMLLGGVPYYLNQIDSQIGFIAAINEALFTKKSIFISEVDEILNLEFNRAGVKKTKQILSALGILGGPQSNVKSKINISDSTLSESVSKLCDYSILKEKSLIFPSKNTQRGSKYFYNDPYLLFYFGLIDEVKEEVVANEDRLIFSELLGSHRSYSISNFTGRSFEIFIRNLLTQESTNFQKYFFKKIGIHDKKINFFDEYSEDRKGPDFYIIHKNLRTLFAIECKWTTSAQVVGEGVKQLVDFKKNFSEKNKLEIKNLKLILISNYECSAQKIKQMSDEGIVYIQIGKLIDDFIK